MKFLGRKLNFASKRLGGKLSAVGKTFGRKMNHHHHHHSGHYLDDQNKSDLERNHNASPSHYEHRHETRPMGHNIHKHAPLTGAPFMTHGADHRAPSDRKKNH